MSQPCAWRSGTSRPRDMFRGRAASLICSRSPPLPVGSGDWGAEGGLGFRVWHPEHAETGPWGVRTGPWGVRTAVLALRRLPAVRVAADDLRPFHDLWCDECFSSLSDPRDHTGRGRGDRAEGQRMLTAPEAGGSESRVSLGPLEEEMSCGRRSDLLRPPACGGALRQPRQATGLPRRVRSARLPFLSPLLSLRAASSALSVCCFPFEPPRLVPAGPCWPGGPGGASGRLRPSPGPDARRVAPVSPAGGARPRGQQELWLFLNLFFTSVSSSAVCMFFTRRNFVLFM